VTDARVIERSGPHLEDFEVGDVLRSRIGRTVTETDNVWFTCLTMNTNQAHFNSPYARAGRYERPLVNSTFTLALVTGLTVPDTSENAVANLGWSEVALPNPVFVGDTLWAETEVLAVRSSESNPDVGIVSVRSRGINDRGEVVIEFRRAFMVRRREAAANDPALFPSTDEAWRT
jgi:itaconyl-CoA hydratase